MPHFCDFHDGDIFIDNYQLKDGGVILCLL